MDVASFLKKIGDVLSEHRTTARDLEALEFAADGRDVSIRVRSKPHGSCYPPLAVILASIGRTCHEQRVALPQLSRIAFLSDEVRVELGDAGQRPAKVYRFPIQGVLGAPTPEQTPLQLVAARLARTGDWSAKVNQGVAWARLLGDLGHDFRPGDFFYAPGDQAALMTGTKYVPGRAIRVDLDAARKR